MDFYFLLPIVFEYSEGPKSPQPQNMKARVMVFIMPSTMDSLPERFSTHAFPCKGYEHGVRFHMVHLHHYDHVGSGNRPIVMLQGEHIAREKKEDGTIPAHSLGTREGVLSIFAEMLRPVIPDGFEYVADWEVPHKSAFYNHDMREIVDPVKMNTLSVNILRKCFGGKIHGRQLPL